MGGGHPGDAGMISFIVGFNGVPYLIASFFGYLIERNVYQSGIVAGATFFAGSQVGRIRRFYRLAVCRRRGERPHAFPYLLIAQHGRNQDFANGVIPDFGEPYSRKPNDVLRVFGARSRGQSPDVRRPRVFVAGHSPQVRLVAIGVGERNRQFVAAGGAPGGKFLSARRPAVVYAHLRIGRCVNKGVHRFARPRSLGVLVVQPQPDRSPRLRRKGGQLLCVRRRTARQGRRRNATLLVFVGHRSLSVGIHRNIFFIMRSLPYFVAEKTAEFLLSRAAVVMAHGAGTVYSQLLADPALTADASRAVAGIFGLGIGIAFRLGNRVFVGIGYVVARRVVAPRARRGCRVQQTVRPTTVVVMVFIDRGQSPALRVPAAQKRI